MKGGTGKTTTAVNLSTGLILLDKNINVLAVDLDPQSNLSITFGIDVINLKQSMGDVLMNEETRLHDILYRLKRLHIAPATMDLAMKQRQLQALPDGAFHLNDRLQQVRDEYNYIIIDTPPQSTLLLDSALYASDEIIIPIDVGYYSMVGIREFLSIFERIRKRNPKLQLSGVLITFVEQTVLARDVMEAAKRQFGDSLFRSVIHKNVRLAEAPSAHKPIYLYDSKCTGSQDYIGFCREFLARNRAKAKADRTAEERT